jgi:hypothetical protein
MIPLPVSKPPLTSALALTSGCPVSETTNSSSPVPSNPNTLLTREQTARALTAAGFPVAAATLATLASRGGGPGFRSFGARRLYEWRTAWEWARAKLGPLQRSTSESDVAQKEDVE